MRPLFIKLVNPGADDVIDFHYLKRSKMKHCMSINATKRKSWIEIQAPLQIIYSQLSFPWG